MVDHTKLILDAEWYVVENDVIGGWAISTVNLPVSGIDPRKYGVYIVGEMLSIRVAEHIVDLHNRR